MLAGQPLACNPLLQEVLEGMGQVGFFLLSFPGWAETVEQVCPLPVCSHSISGPPATNYPRSKGTRQST